MGMAIFLNKIEFNFTNELICFYLWLKSIPRNVISFDNICRANLELVLNSSDEGFDYICRANLELVLNSRDEGSILNRYILMNTSTDKHQTFFVNLVLSSIKAFRTG